MAVLFAGIAVLVGADLLSDAGSGAGGLHLGAEALGTLFALFGAGLTLRALLADRREQQAWRDQAEALLARAGTTVEQRFAAWDLSPAEAEVGLLLLKGLSLKEIAAVRGTGERTSREQARAVYKKAGVAGRAELAAWFMEDLLGDRAG